MSDEESEKAMLEIRSRIHGVVAEMFEEWGDNPPKLSWQDVGEAIIAGAVDAAANVPHWSYRHVAANLASMTAMIILNDPDNADDANGN